MTTLILLMFLTAGQAEGKTDISAPWQKVRKSILGSTKGVIQVCFGRDIPKCVFLYKNGPKDHRLLYAASGFGRKSRPVDQKRAVDLFDSLEKILQEQMNGEKNRDVTCRSPISVFSRFEEATYFQICEDRLVKITGAKFYKWIEEGRLVAEGKLK